MLLSTPNHGCGDWSCTDWSTQETADWGGGGRQNSAVLAVILSAQTWIWEARGTLMSLFAGLWQNLVLHGHRTWEHLRDRMSTNMLTKNSCRGLPFSETGLGRRRAAKERRAKTKNCFGHFRGHFKREGAKPTVKTKNKERQKDQDKWRLGRVKLPHF